MQTESDIPTVCHRAAAAFTALSRLTSESRAAILDSIAAALDARRDEILKTCSDETALTIDELTPEFARMTGTLRMFAATVREGSWVRAAIDTPWHGHPAHASQGLPAPAGSPIGPNHDLRKLLIPLGPVAVFGSSNFPLAYGVCGGDTASALAAGCPVIIKEHPAHPRTGRLLASIAQSAITRVMRSPRGNAGATGAAQPPPTSDSPHAPDRLLQYILNENPKDFSVAQHLVQNEHIAAVGFTGSIPGGLAIEKLARERPVPIPVFAEMGSTNPIFITPGALKTRSEQIGEQVAQSILARFGQQCTRPGLILVPTVHEAALLGHSIAKVFRASNSRRMLAPWVAKRFSERLETIEGLHTVTVLAPRPAPGEPWIHQAVLLGVDLEEFISHPELREEIFGPAAILVILHTWEEFSRVPLGGNLTLSIYFDESDPADVSLARAVLDRHACSAGRIIFNGVPTGVRVATSMVHGGPFPATNRPDTTAVGPLAIERWCRPVCYQNCPHALLPPELQNANPRGIWRTVNGELTKSAVS